MQIRDSLHIHALHLYIGSTIDYLRIKVGSPISEITYITLPRQDRHFHLLLAVCSKPDMKSAALAIKLVQYFPQVGLIQEAVGNVTNIKCMHEHI